MSSLAEFIVRLPSMPHMDSGRSLRSRRTEKAGELNWISPGRSILAESVLSQRLLRSDSLRFPTPRDLRVSIPGIALASTVQHEPVRVCVRPAKRFCASSCMSVVLCEEVQSLYIPQWYINLYCSLLIVGSVTMLDPNVPRA